MAKKNPAHALIEKISGHFEELKKLVGAPAAEPADAAAEETPAEDAVTATVSLPPAEELADKAKTSKEEIAKLGKELNINLEKVSEIRATLVLASKHAAGETLTPDETATLAQNLGLEVSKKQATNAKNISEYLSITDTDKPEEAASADEDDTVAVDSDDTPTPAEEDNDDEKTETVEDDTPAATDGDDDPPVPEEAAAEGPSDAELKKMIVAYNKVTKKPLKPNDVAAMREKLTDDKEVVHGADEGYTKDGSAWANGFPLQDIEGKDYSKCRVSSKLFKYDDSGEDLVEVVKKTK